LWRLGQTHGKKLLCFAADRPPIKLPCCDMPSGVEASLSVSQYACAHLQRSNLGLCMRPKDTSVPMLWPIRIAFLPQFFCTAASTRLAMKSN